MSDMTTKPNARYTTTPPRAFWLDADWFDTDHKTCTVHEDDRTPSWTGLYDANGTRLYRVRETVRVGFVSERAR